MKQHRKGKKMKNYRPYSGKNGKVYVCVRMRARESSNIDCIKKNP